MGFFDWLRRRRQTTSGQGSSDVLPVAGGGKTQVQKGITCTVGAPYGTGVTELLGPAVMVYVTPETKVEQGTELIVGRKVLVDYRLDPRDFGKGRGMLALRVRPYGPDSSDVRDLQQLLERIERAGLLDPGFGEPSSYLDKMFSDRLTQGKTGPVALDQELVRLLEAKNLRFPMNSWQHDIEPAVSEMEENLKGLNVATALPRAPIEAIFERYADESEQTARRHFCAEIAKEANELLASVGRLVRWYQFGDLAWEDDEPFWLLVTPEQRDGLLREKIFEPAQD